MKTLNIKFEEKKYELNYSTLFKESPPDVFIIYNHAAELLKFAPSQFEISYSPGQYPNWKFPPSFGNRFDDLRVAIILALIDRYPGRYMS